MGSRIAPTPRPILSMSLQPIIPWRVALQQSPTPLHRLSTMLKEKQRLEKTITLNGNCVIRRLSHSRGSPHRTDFASNAQWVIWADLYPSAGCLNRHDTDRAAGESPMHGKLSGRGKERHNGFVVDGTGLAAANLSSAERKRNSFTAHRKPWHAGQGEERKCLFCGQSTGLWRLPCEVRQAFVHAW